MIDSFSAGNFSRVAALAILLVASGSTMALADPPGYYFQDLGQSKPSATQTARIAAASPTMPKDVGANPVCR